MSEDQTTEACNRRLQKEVARLKALTADMAERLLELSRERDRLADVLALSNKRRKELAEQVDAQDKGALLLAAIRDAIS